MPWEDFDRDQRRRVLAHQRDQARRLLVGGPRAFDGPRFLYAIIGSALCAAVLTLALPAWWAMIPSVAVALGLSWWVYRAPRR